MLEAIKELGFNREWVLSSFIGLIPEILSAVLMACLAIVFYIITARVFEAALRKTVMQDSLIQITVRSLYRGLIIIIGAILVLGELGVNVTAAIAGVGVLGIAIGFAAQATIANILSGFGIFWDGLYRKGDWVRLADNYGEVVDITLRVTKIRTLDNTYITLPNSLVTQSPLMNISEQGEVRITARVLISFEESIDRARTVLLEAIRHIPGVLQTPEPIVVANEVGEWGVQLFVRIWISEAGQEQRYYFTLTETCKKALDQAGIEIPVPKRDIHMVAQPKVYKRK